MSDDLLRELLAAVREQTDIERQVLDALRKRAPAANSNRTTRARLISKREAARRLGKNPSDFYTDLIHTGLLPVVKCGKVEKVRADDVERLVAEGWTPAGRVSPRRHARRESVQTSARADRRREAEKIEALDF